MGNYEQLKQAVSDVIKKNGNQEITGAIMQNTLLSIISTVGSNATFAGIATPTTNPGTPDQNIFYIASENGTYPNFGGVVLKDEVVIFSNENGVWNKKNTGIASQIQLSDVTFYGGIDSPHWGTPILEDSKRNGIIILNGKFQYNSSYITKLYNLKDIIKGVLSIQEFGNGFYSCGVCDADYNLIKSFVKCKSASGRQNSLYSIISDKTENYLFITSRIDGSEGKDAVFFNQNSGVEKIQEIENTILENKTKIEIINNEQNRYVDIKVFPAEVKNGYFTADNQFIVKGNYETEFYEIEDSDYIINGYDYGQGIISYGYIENISENPDDLLSFYPMNAASVENVIYLLKKSDKPEGAKYIVLTKRKNYEKVLFLRQEKLIVDMLFEDAYNEVIESVSYQGYIPNDSYSWNDNANYKTYYYKINKLVDYKIIGYDLGVGIPSYGFATNTNKERSSIISYIPMNSASDVTEVNVSIRKNEIPINANYIFVVSRNSNPKYLYEVIEKFIPEQNKKRIDILENNQIYTFRARVIEYTDTVNGKEYNNNNVNRTFQMLQVIRKYNSTHDLMICIGLNGPNGMFGLRGWKLIQNSSEKISDFPLENTFIEMGETIGPWQIQSVNNPVGNSGQLFVGGFHALINPNTNNYYPSAKNLGYKYYADNRELLVGQEVFCNTVKAISEVNICSNNTFDDVSNTAREVLNYIDTYQLIDDKIFLFAKFKALEDITINLHYGLQTDKFNPIIGYLTDNGLTETDTSVDYEEKNILFLPSLVYAKKRDGNILFCKMYNKGAMTGERTDNIKAFQLSYGAGNTKTYHWVYGNGKIGNLNNGDANFYCGWFSISDKDPSNIE